MEPELRICKHCNLNKGIECFEIYDHAKNLRRYVCRPCRKYQQDNPKYEVVDAKANFAIYRKKYYETHKEYYKRKNKEYKIRDAEKLVEQRRLYYLKNRDKVLAKSKECRNRRIKREPGFRLLCLMRHRLYVELKNSKQEKLEKTTDLLGCSREHLRLHIESQFKSGMSWDKLGSGPGTFQIDHVKACGLFDFTQESERRACFHYTNLQPLWWEDHLIKTRKDRQLIREYKLAKAQLSNLSSI